MNPKYLRMIRGMKAKGPSPEVQDPPSPRGTRGRNKRDWSVYILRCADNSLYTGITNNVEARIAKHQKGKGATYTRTRLPVELLHQQNGLTRSKALIREAQIKRLPRSKKEKIILGVNLNQADWKLLNKLVKKQSKAHRYKKYKNPQKAKKHFKK